MKQGIIFAFLITFCVPAYATGKIARVEIVDSASGRALSVYEKAGRFYVAGTPGREYSVRLKNRLYDRVLAVVSVDGVNVVTGETASVDQGGYILGSRQRFDVKGWRKSLDHVASFYFSAVEASYAAQTGRPQNVGVIGVALFKARAYRIVLEERSDAGQSRAERSRTPAAKARQSRPGDAPQSYDDATGESSALGTGHGRNQSSVVQAGQFERASQFPSETITIYYDSRANLIARGIIPGPRHRPDPFPIGFVPDPPNC